MAIAIANLTSYVTVAEADTYLAASSRAAALWALVPSTKKERALVSATRMLERQTWEGTKAAGLLNIVSAVVTVGGDTYAVGNVLAVTGGTGVAARVKVATLATAAVATVSMLDAGIYSVEPTSPAATTGGGDNNCTLTLTSAAQALSFPRTDLIDRYGQAVSATTVPQGIKDACCELAFELSQDAELEASRDANSNEKRLKAGSVEIEYFLPADSNGRFPPTVQELINEFLASSAGGATLGMVSEADEDSSFTDCKKYGRTDGF